MPGIDREKMEHREQGHATGARRKHAEEEEGRGDRAREVF